ncbi:MAG: hypothetical protein BZY79_04880 [SAR202 cluster bacterium Casp-Chloro-G4]|nr:universal stress protein [Chloroflexota bacterium]MDA1226403.1 universal stress protein [Chloroflexota bacterium]PKB61217.1 MAG: hypothetical protein BZY79_04880 [SAR202 cluster bacterium Casp-Chloro-G4]
MRYEKILVPLDGSRQAEYILPQLEAMVKAFDADVTLLHVVADKHTNGPEPTRSQKDAGTDITGYMEHIAEALRGKKVRCEWQLTHGDPAEEIAKFAATDMADLIIMTTHGQGTTKKVRTGSVAMEIISSNQIPVMLVRPPISILDR